MALNRADRVLNYKDARECSCLFKVLRLDKRLASFSSTVVEAGANKLTLLLEADKTRHCSFANVCLKFISQASEVLSDNNLERRYYNYGQTEINMHHSCIVLKTVIDYIEHRVARVGYNEKESSDQELISGLGENSKHLLCKKREDIVVIDLIGNSEQE